MVAYGFLAAKRLDFWTASFLAATALTSVTGFVFFPIERFTPAVAILGRYRQHLAGRWRAAYVISSVTAFYFNVFVLVAQLFQKVPVLKDLAPTESEPPFAVAQLVVSLLASRSASSGRCDSESPPFRWRRHEDRAA